MSRKHNNNIFYTLLILGIFFSMLFVSDNVFADEIQGEWYTNNAGDVYYYVNGQATTGIATIENNKYYFNENGVMQTGIVSADGKAYYFSTETGAMRTSTGVFSFNGEMYYSSKGVLKTGWIAYENKAYYFHTKGEKKYQATKDSTIGYLTIPSRGYLGRAYYLGIKKLNGTKWTLKQAYKNSYKLKYANRSMRKTTSEKYAAYAFSKKKGNCYCMAATFYIQAKLLGYNVRQIEGKVNEYWPHSWTQIKHGKKWYVYDPNFRNETGRSGWKIYYGKKGTWKYMKYHVFQN